MPVKNEILLEALQLFIYFERRLYNIAESRGLGDYQNCLYEGESITETQINLQDHPLTYSLFFSCFVLFLF